jgi:hypothetical protein
VDFMAVSPPDLFQSNRLRRIPQCMPSVGLESVLSTYRQDGEQQLGRQVRGGQGGKVEKRKMLMEAVYVSFQEPCQSMSGRKDKVMREHRMELVELISDDGVVLVRYPPRWSPHAVVMHS